MKIRERNLIYFGWAFGSAVFFRAVYFTYQQWQRPWPDLSLAIDGGHFMEGAERLVWGESLFAMRDIYHSPGYQIFLGLLLRISGSRAGLIAWSKVLSLAMFAVSCGLTYRLGKNYFDQRVGTLAAALVAGSTTWLYYVNMIQYEVLCGFLLLLWLYSRTRETRAARIIEGAALFFLCLVHVKFALLLAVPLLTFLWRKRSWKSVLPSAAAFSLLAAWSAFYSFRAGSLVWVMDRREFLFRLGNNLKAQGVAYPHVQISEPSGWEFIWNFPARFLWLVGQRFLYLFGIKPDIWYVPQNPTALYSLFALASSLIFLTALLAFRKEWRSRADLYVTMLATSAPCLMIYAHQRFLVPMLPVVAIFQAALFMKLLSLRYPRATLGAEETN